MSLSSQAARTDTEWGSRVLSKVRHSAFYSTPLGYLLGRLGTKRLVLTGQVTEQCIPYSALAAYVRHFPVVIPIDVVARIDASRVPRRCTRCSGICPPSSQPRQTACIRPVLSNT